MRHSTPWHRQLIHRQPPVRAADGGKQQKRRGQVRADGGEQRRRQQQQLRGRRGPETADGGTQPQQLRGRRGRGGLTGGRAPTSLLSSRADDDLVKDQGESVVVCDLLSPSSSTISVPPCQFHHVAPHSEKIPEGSFRTTSSTTQLWQSSTYSFIGPAIRRG